MTVLSREQLDQIRAKMEEEHKKDLEAVERLSRFLPFSQKAMGGLRRESQKAGAAHDDEEPSDSESLIGRAEQVVLNSPNQVHTSRSIYEALHSAGVQIPPEKRALTTLGTALTKLANRGRIRLVRKGKGRNPNTYRAPKKEQTQSEGIAQVLDFEDKEAERQAVN